MNMQDYHNYLQETEGPNRGCVFNENGFATYVITGEECYIDKIYTKPEARKTNVAAKLADKIVVIAKEMGCNCLSGTVYTNGTTGDTNRDMNNYDRSVRVLLGYGFKPLRFEEGRAWFMKEI